MEPQSKDESTLRSANIVVSENANPRRSAPTVLSKAILTPCRRVGLKRKSTPGIIFQSPLKDSSRNCEQIRKSSLQCSVDSNFFPEKADSAGQDETKVDLSSKKNQEGFETCYLPVRNQPQLENQPVQFQKKLGTTRVSTPKLIKHGSVKHCSLSKKLKLSPVSPNGQDSQHSSSRPLNLSKLEEALSKNHDNFLTLYNNFTSRNQKDKETSPERQNVILRMKRMYDQITELKQSLLNAKQHDIKKLESLTGKWRDACQEALHLLLEKLQQQGHECDMSQLLHRFGIPNNLVKYDEDTQDFAI